MPCGASSRHWPPRESHRRRRRHHRLRDGVRAGGGWLRVAGREMREFGIEAWDTADVRSREPALATRVRGAMFVGADHWVNNQRLVVAYAQAAVAAGVILRAGTSVSRVIVEDGRTHGVVADGDRCEADAVLLAAGAWTAAL